MQLDDDSEDKLAIPKFLKRNPDNTFMYPELLGLSNATVTAAVPEPEPTQVEPEPGDEFARFNAGLYDPEPDIEREAKKRRREWMPTKDDPRQPSLRSMTARVRAEWKKEGRI